MLPVVNCALGFTKKRMRSTVEKMAGRINLEELQKITLMGAAHILRKVLSTDLWCPVYPKTYGLDLDLQEDKPDLKETYSNDNNNNDDIKGKIVQLLCQNHFQVLYLHLDLDWSRC